MARLYKGSRYEIQLLLSKCSLDTIEDVKIAFYTTDPTASVLVKEGLVVNDNIASVVIESTLFDNLNDGLIKYIVYGTKDGLDYMEERQSNYYLRTDNIQDDPGTGGNPGVIDLTNYYTKRQVDSLLTLHPTFDEMNKAIQDAEIDIEIDLSDYYTKEEIEDIVAKRPTYDEMNTAIADAVKDIPSGGGGDADLGDYYTKTEVDTIVDTVQDFAAANEYRISKLEWLNFCIEATEQNEVYPHNAIAGRFKKGNAVTLMNKLQTDEPVNVRLLNGYTYYPLYHEYDANSNMAFFLFDAVDYYQAMFITSDGISFDYGLKGDTFNLRRPTEE